MALLVLLAGAAGAGRVARGVRIVRTGVLGALLDTAALTGTGVLQLLGLLLLLAQRGDHGLRLLRYGLGVLVLRGVLRGLRSLGGRSGLLRFLGVLRLVLRLLGPGATRGIAEAVAAAEAAVIWDSCGWFTRTSTLNRKRIDSSLMPSSISWNMS